MEWHWRAVALLILGIATYSVILAACRLMNLPSDRAFIGGLSLIVALLVIVPILARTIWRKL